MIYSAEANAIQSLYLISRVNNEGSKSLNLWHAGTTPGIVFGDSVDEDEDSKRHWIIVNIT